MKKIAKLVLIICLIAVVALSAFGCKEKKKSEQLFDDRFDLTNKVLAFIEENAYDDVDYDLVDLYAAYGLVYSLGDYNYLNAITEFFGAGSDKMGFGLLLKNNKYNEHIINTILPGSPFATEAIGARRGDEIYAINGQRISGLETAAYSAVVSATNALEPTTFLLKRGEETFEVTCTKAMVSFPNCIYVDDLEGVPTDFGYIRISSFENSSSIEKDFKNAVQSFNNDGNRALILDLRGNGGGNSAVFATIASALIGNVSVGTPLLEVQYAKQNRTSIVYTQPAEYKIDAPIYVLCDGGTASASEALIGAMKAHGTLTSLIGQNTVGKGVAQITYTDGKNEYIIDKSTDSNGKEVNSLYHLQVVVGKYYIYDNSVDGGKYCIHKKPFTPDVLIEDPNVISPDYSEDVYIAAAIEQYSAYKNS